MITSVHLSLEPEAPASVVTALSRMLAKDFRDARNTDDLQRRLERKGYQIRLGFLATAPHGKLICPLSQL